jgi:hypothetical protein
MAVFTRIQFVNFLSEGWQPSMGAAKWQPLWPANTITLGGWSTAVQLDNGSGKTSATNAMLFLLSRDKRLKAAFLSRCAPYESGYTHVRIEFGVPNDDSDVLQADLLPSESGDPTEFRGTNYVIGVCANRGDEDRIRFYRYCGLLEDAPAYEASLGQIRFTDNDTFKQSISRVPHSEWNAWPSAKDWGRMVGEFISIDVVKQNVQFHLKGGGDASASLQNIQVRTGERFDEAFFRQVVAPQLLSNAMGEAAEEDERTIEDTITRSMYRFIEAKLNVEKKQRYLDQREEAEKEFVPVRQAADDIGVAEREYASRLSDLTKDAAFLQHFGAPGGMPGIPRSVDGSGAKDELREFLNGMAIDHDGTLLVQDAALAKLTGQTTGNLNLDARRSSSSRRPVQPYAASAQVIDFDCNIKTSEGSGGRRKAENYYEEAAAAELLGYRPGGQDKLPLLTQAFDLARLQFDSNPFRQEARRVRMRQALLRTQSAEHGETAKSAETLRVRLESSQHERQENEAAYKEYKSNLNLVPEVHHPPALAAAWLELELAHRQQAIRDHDLRVGQLTPDWTSWKATRDRLGLQSPGDRLEELQAQFGELEDRFAEMTARTAEAEDRRDKHREVAQSAKEKSATKTRHFEEMSELALGSGNFAAIFGAVDPSREPDPVDELNRLTKESNSAQQLADAATRQVEELRKSKREATLAFNLFDESELMEGNPVVTLAQLNERKHAAQLNFSQHAPLTEALELFQERFQNTDPQQWLMSADERRDQAIRDADILRRQALELSQDIGSLRATAAVDDREHSRALEALAANEIHVERASSVVVTSTRDKDRALRGLSALSGLTSAPVVKLADMDQALLVLQRAKLHVVVLARERLEQALADESSMSVFDGGAVLGFLAGVRTRRVEALVDPGALQSEIDSLQGELDQAEMRASALEEEAAGLAPLGEAYLLAVNARDAQRQRSPDKSRAAQAELAELEKALPGAQRKAAADALASLSSARAFTAAGGETKLEASDGEATRRKSDYKAATEQLALHQPKTTPQARLAFTAARSFALQGGAPELEAARAAAATAQEDANEQASRLAKLQEEFEDLRKRLQDVSAQRNQFSEPYHRERGELESAVKFEADGHHLFMAQHETKGLGLTGALGALAPLQRVNFARAEAYLGDADKDGKQLQDEIAAAVAQRDEATSKSQACEREAQAMDDGAMDAERAARVLHGVAHLLLTKRATVAPYLEDLARREGGPTPSAAHPMFAAAEDLNFRLTHWTPAEGYFAWDGLKTIHSELDAMELTAAGTKLRESQRAAKAARKHFIDARDRYCEKMAAKPDNPLSQPEMDAIKGAESSEQIKSLAELAQQLRRAIEQERDEYQQLLETVQAVESESLDTLARLVAQAKFNLEVMNKTMRRNEKARFEIDATIIADEEIRKLMLELRDHIEQVRREAISRARITRQDKDDSSIRSVVSEALAARVFTGVAVKFRHIGIWDGALSPINSVLSEGQKATLQMMWLIKESEYHLERAVREHLGKGSRKKLLSRSKRVLIFDGLFSNLSNSKLIEEAFKGLGDAGSNLQLVGLIHNPEYRNDFRIFPSFMIGKREGWNGAGARRSYVTFKDGRSSGAIGLASFMFDDPQAGVPGAESAGD